MVGGLHPARLVGGPWSGRCGRVAGAPETIELAGWTYRRTGDRVPVTDYDPITDVLDTREGWAYEWDGLDPSGNRIDRETSLVLP